MITYNSVIIIFNNMKTKYEMEKVIGWNKRITCTYTVYTSSTKNNIFDSIRPAGSSRGRMNFSYTNNQSRDECV